MIYITGDTHGLDGVLERISQLPAELSKDDYLIIAGDCGLIWASDTLQSNIDEIRKIPCNILFVDGNHENFDILNSYPIETWHGGKVHKISENLIHLMRGQVFEIEGKTFFTFGGATSRDKERRTEHISWWKEEEPDDADYEEAEKNIILCNKKIDYVITHAPLSCVVKRLYAYSFADYYCGNPKYSYENNPVSFGISNLFEKYKIPVKTYFSGHQHLDKKMNIFDKTYLLLYKEIVAV